MNNFLLFLKDFFKNKGLMVFSSMLIEKLVGLINVIFVVRMISEKDYGTITLIASLFGVLITMNGFGTIQGLLRYGSLEKEAKDKTILANFIFKEGLKRHLLLMLLFVFCSIFYELKYENIWIIIVFFLIRMLGVYFYSFILSYYRIQYQNNKFSAISMFINCFGVLISIFLTYYTGTMGYLTSLAITPWLALIFYKKEIYLPMSLPSLDFEIKEFWNYCLNSSFTYLFSETLFVIDVFLIGYFLNEEAVANYKVAIILPMNLMFIPLTFIQTDLPKIISNSTNKSYLKFYIHNYYKIFIPLTIIILTTGYFIKDWILQFVFGNEYQENGWIFFIILFSVCCNMCLRNLYGNLLSAIGYVKQNTIISIVSIILMILLSLVTIPFFGIIGLAISLAITFISMGICSSLIFHRYLIKI